jgi:LPS sulfotransferase NodH
MAKAMIQIRVTPRSGSSLLSNSRSAKPCAGPHLCFRTEVQTLSGLEDHVWGFHRWFIKSLEVD